MDRITGFVVFSLGICILWQGRNLPVGRLSAPGSGFFPNLMAAILIILSLFLVVPRRKKRPEGQVSYGRPNKRAVAVFLALLVYFFFLEYLGFVVTSFLLMIFLFIGIDSQKWYKALVYAFISIGLVYVLFEILLKSQLPKGIFGF